MMPRPADQGPAQAFFLPAQPGQRFCLLHPPSGGDRAADGVLHIHAFGEELNACRRSAALLARTLAAHGLAVLQIDLLGCGDSSGDFADANWAVWQNDLEMALTFLQQEYSGKIHLWTDRLGALLAMQLALQHPQRFDQLLLCQPVVDGRQYISQLKRSLRARAMFGPQQAQAEPDAGGMEIGGYEIGSALSEAISAVQAADWRLPVRRIDWIETVGTSSESISPARSHFVQHWQQLANPVQLHCLPGEAFWQIPQATASAHWIEACARIFKGQS